jgi:hypothetical protein
VPFLKATITPFNVVLFRRRYYIVPHGLVVNWEKDDVEALPGVAIRGSLEEALELIRSGRMPPPRTPILQMTVKSINIVLFNGRYYCLPQGLAVDWEKDDVEMLRGVVVFGSLDEAVEAIKRR